MRPSKSHRQPQNARTDKIYKAETQRSRVHATRLNDKQDRQGVGERGRRYDATELTSAPENARRVRQLLDRVLGAMPTCRLSHGPARYSHHGTFCLHRIRPFRILQEETYPKWVATIGPKSVVCTTSHPYSRDWRGCVVGGTLVPSTACVALHTAQEHPSSTKAH